MLSETLQLKILNLLGTYETAVSTRRQIAEGVGYSKCPMVIANIEDLVQKSYLDRSELQYRGRPQFVYILTDFGHSQLQGFRSMGAL